MTETKDNQNTKLKKLKQWHNCKVLKRFRTDICNWNSCLLIMSVLNDNFSLLALQVKKNKVNHKNY